MPSASLPNRRRFLKSAAQASVVALAPCVIPARALGKDGAVAPSERIVLGGIGINHRGMHVLQCMVIHPDVQIRAVCDVRADRRQAVKQWVDSKYGNSDCSTYRDLRELLARDDLDAVVIATGDRWHALASVMAAAAGKDVYSEKPCCLTMAQCRLLADAMRRYGRVFQAGTQRRNVANFKFAVELAHSGRLGKIHTVHAGIEQIQVRYDWLPAQPEPPRETVDWNLWLGPAPWRPYHPDYIAGAWRFHYDFESGGHLLDWGAHTVNLCQWANRADDTAPVDFEPSGNRIYARYANGVKLVIRPDGWLNVGGCSIRIEGEEGWVETGDSGIIEMAPAALRAEQARTIDLYPVSKRVPQPVYEGVGVSALHHARNFLDCVKTRRQPTTDAEITRHSHVACHGAAIAYLLGRKLAFDPAKEEFINDPEANRMRSRAMREPWQL